ncbi:MAG: cytochrome c-type biogenesis protein CcmH [Thiotrichales bacterium]|nr:cytochrome c-type biogenesis protein CcmH [Thiotrichales bacterium]MCY4286491.1 cytochrome c-type biogenesis protein CcmH [Thiotrichales bacterium]MCY4348952.1 cytochrome c-type biogenesis protein CcmH [Thiotrichales bacterium]
MRILALIALIATMTLGSTTADARSMFEPRGFSSPERERRYHALVDELRCLVCQNQTIAESNADLASDLRREVYRMVEDGRSEAEIAEFMVARYGDFVLYRPPLRPGTVLLWVGPFLLAAVGLAVLVAHLRRRRRAPATPLGEADRARLQRIIGAED